MTDFTPIRLTMQVFEEDDPALYAHLLTLPDNNHRRRAHLVRLLRLGLEAQDGMASAVSPVSGQDAAGSARRAARKKTLDGDQSRNSPEAAQPTPPLPGPMDQVIPAEDIQAIFG